MGFWKESLVVAVVPPRMNHGLELFGTEGGRDEGGIKERDWFFFWGVRQFVHRCCSCLMYVGLVMHNTLHIDVCRFVSQG